MKCEARIQLVATAFCCNKTQKLRKHEKRLSCAVDLCMICIPVSLVKRDMMHLNDFDIRDAELTGRLRSAGILGRKFNISLNFPEILAKAWKLESL